MPETSRPHLGALLLIVGAWLLVAGWIGQQTWAQSGPLQPGFMPLHNLHLGLRAGDVTAGGEPLAPPLSRLEALEGRPVPSLDALLEEVRRHPLGTPLHYRFLTPEGAHLERTIRTTRFDETPIRHEVLNYLVAGFLHLATGLVVLWLRPHHPAARAHWGFCVLMAFLLVANLNPALPLGFYLFHLGLSLAIPVFTALALECPVSLGSPRWRWRLQGLAWGLAALHAGLFLAVVHHPAGWFFFYDKLFMASALMPFVLLVAWCWEAASPRFPLLVRSQARVILLGGLLSLCPFPVCYFLPQLFGFGPWMPGVELSDVLFAVFPIAIGFAIVRHQLFDLTWVLRRATLYALLLAGLGALYAGVSALCALVLSYESQAQPPSLVSGFFSALVVALAFQPSHQWLRRQIDRLFLGKRADALRTLETVGAWATGDVTELGRRILDSLEEALSPQWASLHFGASPLATLGSPPDSLADLQASSSLVLPLHNGDARRGSLYLGPKRNELPYTAEEQRLLRVLASQAALGLHHALLLEERVRLRLEEALERHHAEERLLLLLQIVHDLRSDLFNISLSSHLLRAALPAGAETALAGIDASVARMEAFLMEKARWAREGRSDTSSRLNAALRGALAALAGTLAEREQRLEHSAPPVDVALPVSQLECEQILINLLSNASKFSPPGSTIRLKAQLVDDALCLRVADEGPGIPPALLATPGSGQRGAPDVPGSGLGLQNVIALLERIGGDFSWHNEARGAVVEIWLPACEAELA